MGIEYIAAIILLTAALVCAWPEIKGMATTSLWQDEIYTVDQFSSRGPTFVMMHYNTNNHIFFNLLTSMTSKENWFEPLPARFWSFVFVAVGVIAGVGYHVWAGRPLEGSAQSFLLLANIRTLDLLLQARGYGFLALAALLCVILAWHYFRHPSYLSLVAMPAVVLLGTWTVPTFVLFGGGLLLAMLVYSGDRRWLFSGGGAVVAIGLVYWPVHSALVNDVVIYASQWGKQFANWDAISNLLSSYLFFGASSWLTLLLVVLVIAGLSHARTRSAKSKASVCSGFSILFTLVVCLKMRTPPERTVVYLVVPLAFILLTVVEDSSRLAITERARLRIMTVVVLVALGFTARLHNSFRFYPIEAWRETAQRIARRFPEGTEVVAQFRPERLKIYLAQNYPIVPKIDLIKFREGRQIVVDSSFLATSRFPLQALPMGYQTEIVPQRRGGMQRIYFFPFAPRSLAQ